MASGKTTTHEADVIDHFLRGVTKTTKTAYIALYSIAPGEGGGGTELTGLGYARELVGLGAPAGGISKNVGAVTFTAAGGSWSAIVGHAIVDAATLGNIQYYQDTVGGPTLNDGDSYEFSIDAITVTET